MNHTPSHLVEALARAQKHWLEHHEGASMPTEFTIALSREAGTYGALVARKAADRLGWPVYDQELLQRIADDMGVRRALLESVDERKVGWVSESLSGLLAVPQVSTTAYYRTLVETLLSLAAHGKCVIVGRGATCVLPPPKTLRVRVIAPLEHRIEAVRREHGCSVSEAAARVNQTDRERNRFIRDHFDCDAKDPANYDLVLNAAAFTPDEAAALVLAALDQLQHRDKTSERLSLRQTAAAT